MPSLVEIDPMVQEEKSSIHFRNFAIISPLGRAWPFINLNKTESPLYPIICFVPGLVEIGTVVLEKKMKM